MKEWKIDHLFLCYLNKIVTPAVNILVNFALDIFYECNLQVIDTYIRILLKNEDLTWGVYTLCPKRIRKIWWLVFFVCVGAK